MPKTSPEQKIEDILRQLIERIEADVARGVARGLKRTGLARVIDDILGKEAGDDPEPEISETEQDEPQAQDRSRCSVSGCKNPVRARGMCSRHYQQVRYAEKKKAEGRDGPRKTDKRGGQPCSVEGCDRPNYARGMCGKHFMEWVRAKKSQD